MRKIQPIHGEAGFDFVVLDAAGATMLAPHLRLPRRNGDVLMIKEKSPRKRKSSSPTRGKPARQSGKSVAKSASLTEQAYEAIKEKVITLYFLPGQYLNEAAIC